MSFVRAFFRYSLISCLLWAGAVSAAWAATDTTARQTWQLLDYVAVDYAGAVQNGRVTSPAEYAEMREFAATVRTQLAALPGTPAQPALVSQADRLVSAVEAKEDPKAVAELAHRLADDLLANYPIGAIPASPPEPARAAAL
jgi:high-affinity iron transporter